jgi:hypothetical protein
MRFSRGYEREFGLLMLFVAGIISKSTTALEYEADAAANVADRALPTDAECLAFGFARADVRCTACDLLADHLPEGDAVAAGVAEECQSCCTEGSTDDAAVFAPGKVTAAVDAAWLECDRDTVKDYAVVAAFKEQYLKGFKPRLTMRHVHGAKPRLLLRDVDGNEETVSVLGWEAGVIAEFLNKKFA